MNDIAIEVSHIWKKFHRGELHNSFRDLIPALAKRLVGRAPVRTDLATDEFWALKDVSFQLKRGEALGIIGPNGAGKSTMLKILSRILRPNQGYLRVKGRLSALIEVAAGFHPDLTGRENIALNGSILGMKTREVERKLDEIVDFSGIRPFIDTPVKRYSSGMQARLGFSVAAHLDPDVLLIDEVLSVGDAQFQRRCIENMKSKLEQGVTVIFVSHNMPAVVDLCPKVLVLHHGEIAFVGDSQEGCQQYMNLLSDKHEAASSSDVDIIQASFKASDRNFLRPGEEFDFQIRLFFRNKVENPTFALLLHRVSDNLPLYDVAAQECGLPFRVYEAGEEILIQFRARAHLLRGIYAIGFNVFLPIEHKFLIRVHSLCQFSVQEDASYAGVVDLACEPSETQIMKQDCVAG